MLQILSDNLEVCLFEDNGFSSLLSLPLDRVTRQLIFVSKEDFLCAYPPSWKYASSSFRQFGSFVCWRRMGSLFSLPLDRITRQLIFLSPKKPFFCACLHSWEKECTGRPGFSSGALGYRWDAGSQISGIHIPEIFSFPTGGPLCFEPHFEIVHLTGSFSS